MWVCKAVPITSTSCVTQVPYSVLLHVAHVR